MATRPRRTPPRQPVPWLEFAGSGLGGLFALGVLGVIVWHGITKGDTPPDITLETIRVEPGSGGFTAHIRAKNSGTQTASELTVEGTAGGETGTTVFDLVPGGAEREGALVFRKDPGAAGVDLRVLGYRDP